MRPLSPVFVALVSAAALVACDSAPAPAARPPAQAKPKPAAAVEEKKEAAVAAAVVEYAYNPTAKRDPFRPPEEIRGPIGTEGNAACTEPLCQWDLDQLDLKAVVTGDANPFAMVIDPKGAGYIVKRNTRVGRQGGRVTQILRDQITITEYWTRPDGKREQVAKDMRIVESKSFMPAVDLVTGKTFE